MADPNAQDTGQVAQPPPVTDLPDDQERLYRAWMDKNHLTGKDGMNVDSGYTGRDYDMRGYFQEHGPTDVKPGQHFPDTYKLPNHSTFSDQSRYAVGENAAKAGHWDGDKFVPPMQEVTVTGKKEKSKPTPEDIAWLNEKPERWPVFEQAFGSLPDGWSADNPTKPTPTQEDLDWLKADPKRADQFKKSFGSLPKGYGQPESSWGDVGRASITAIGAGEERMAAAVQESGGAKSFATGAVGNLLSKATGKNAPDISSPAAQAKVSFWQATVLPEAEKWAQENGKNITDDPLLINAAAHVGMRPDQFARARFDFHGKSPEELQAFKDKQRDLMQAGQASQQQGAERRKQAGAVEEAYAPNVKEGSLKSAAFTAAVQAPDIAAAVGVGLIPGMQGVSAGMLATDMATRAYSSGRDAGLSDADAKGYGALTGATAFLPGVTVGKMLSKAPGMSAIMETAIGKALGRSAGNVISGGVDQTLSISAMNLLQQGVDKGYVSPDMTVAEALTNVLHEMVGAAGTAFAISGAHSGIHRLAHGPQTPADINERQAADEIMAKDAEAKAKDAEKSAKDAAGKDQGPALTPAQEANETGLRALMSGEKVDPKTLASLTQQGLVNIGKKTGQPMVLPAGRRALAEIDTVRKAAEAKQAETSTEDTDETKTRQLRAGAPDALPVDKTGGAAAPVGGEEADVTSRAPRTPGEAEDAIGAETRRSGAFDQMEGANKASRAKDEDRAYAERAAGLEAGKEKDRGEAKNQVAEQTLEQAPHVGGPDPTPVTMKDALEVTKKKAADIAVSIPRAEGLSPEEREIENNFVNKIAANPQKIMDEYANDPETLHGKIISADSARKLSDDFVRDPSLAQEIHEPASWLANMMYRRALAQPLRPGEDNLAVLMAGAPASGKSSTMERAGPLTKRAQVIFDAVMSSPDSALDKVEAALNAGKYVSIPYVYQSPREAFKASLLRAMETRRSVPAPFQKLAHEGTPEAIRAVVAKYGDDPRVQVIGIDNSLGDGKAQPVSFEEILKKPHSITMGEMRDIAREFLNDGKIDENVYERTIGSKPPAASARGEDKNVGRGDDKNAQPEHQGRESGQAVREAKPELSDAEKAKLARAESRARRRVADERTKEYAMATESGRGPFTRIAEEIPPAQWEKWVDPEGDGENGIVSSKDFLEKVTSAASGKGQDPRFKALAMALHKYAPDIKIEFTDVIRNREGVAVQGDVKGYFTPGTDPSTSRIQIDRSMDSAGIVRAVMHELVHVATSYEFERNSNGPLATRITALLSEAKQLVGERYGHDLVEQHIDYFNGVGSKPENFLRELYGLTNPHEFMAEGFSSADFQALLAEVAPPDRMNSGAMPKTIFKKFVEIVRDFLAKTGVGINSSLVEDVVSTTGELIRQQAKRNSPDLMRTSLDFTKGKSLAARDDKKELGADVVRDIGAKRMTKLVTSAAELGALKIARGIARFEDWSDAMVQELGKGVKPVLDQLYQMAKDKMVDVRGMIYKTNAKGNIVGGPQGSFKQTDVAPLRAQLRRLAREGEFGKDWYKESSDALMQAVGGNKADAKKLAGLFSIFSAGAAVDANTTMALRAWYQYKAGKPIEVGTWANNEVAQRWLDFGTEPTGMKRSNFYGNLLQSLEGDNQRMYSGGVTVDRWMMRALGYTREAPSDAQYAFVADQIRRTAKTLGWTSEQVQAAVWVSIKARWEAVRGEVNKEALKKGWIEPKRSNNPKATPELKVIDPERYYGRMLDKALEYSVSKQEIAKAATNFRDTLLRHRAQVSWEAMPGVASGRLPGADKLPVEALAAFQRDVSAAHANPATGSDQLQEALGLLSQGRVNGNSAWFRDPGQVMRFRHWGPEGLDTLDPAKQGTGAAGTLAERNRETKVVSLYPYALNEGHQPEPQVSAGKHQYVVEVPAERLYDASRDPRGFKQAAMEPVSFTADGEPDAFAYSHDEFEKLVKGAGLAGYYVDEPSDKLMHGQARLFEPTRATPVDKYVDTGLEPYAKAGAQDVIYAPLDKKIAAKAGAPLDPNARASLESYAAAMGKVNNQDSVGWHRPRFGVPQRDGNGLDFKLPGAGQEEFMRAYKAAFDAVRAEGIPDSRAAEFAPIQTPDGFRFINWGTLENRRFQEIVKKAINDTFPSRDLAATHFAADGGLINARDYDTVIAGNGHGKLLAGPIADVGRRVEAVYREFAQRHGLQDSSRASSGRQGAGAEASAPIPLAQLKTRAGLYENVMSRFGKLTGGSTVENLKLYDLKPLIDNPTRAADFAKSLGFDVEHFSFESDPSKGVEFKLPRLGKSGYEGGKLWIYDPRVGAGSFYDEGYTRAWRIAHELGHALTENFLSNRYGESRRYGRLGQPTTVTRGVLGKQREVDTRALTLAEAQRAVEWEDAAFRAQRQILEKLGVTISDANFAREYNVNLADALYRVLSADFGDPGLNGFVPNESPGSLKETLSALADAEAVLARDQKRAPTEGINLDNWQPIDERDIRQVIENRLSGVKDVKFSVRPEETMDYRIVAKDRDGNEVAGPHSDLQFSSSEDAADAWPTFERQKGLKYSIEPVSRDPYKNQLLEGRNAPGKSGRFLSELSDKYPKTNTGDNLVNGNVLVGMVNDPIQDGTIYVSYVRSITPGLGEGTRAMRDVVGMADKHGVALELNAVPLDAKGLPNEKLLEWYRKLGFKDVEDSTEVNGEPVNSQLMRREPSEKPEPVPVFATNAGKGISAKDAQSVIDHAKRMFPGAQHHLVESVEDLPHEVQAIAEMRGVSDRVAAVYTREYDGTHTYLVRNNTTTVEDALHTMIEENVGHDGIAKTFGPKVGALMDGFLRNDRLRTSIAKMAQQEGINIMAAKDPLERKEAWRAAAEEWLAHAAAKNPDKWTGIQRTSFNSVFSEMKVWAASHGLPITLTQEDARTVLTRAHRYVSTGAWIGNVTEAREAAAANVVNLGQFKQDRQDAADLKTFHGTLMQSVSDRAQRMQAAIDAVPHKYAVGDRVRTGKGNVWKITGLDVSKWSAQNAADVTANKPGYHTKAERDARKQQPDLPAYRVESLDGTTKTTISEWGITDKFAGPQSVKFATVPKSGNTDLDELLNDKIGAPHIGWRTRLTAAVHDIGSRLVTSGLDRMNRVKEYEDDLKIPAAESGYLSMRLSTNVAPLLRNLIEFGHLKWTGTAGFDPDKSMVSDFKEGKPLNTVLAPLHNDPIMLRRFEGYLVALRAKELSGQGRENLLEQRHIQAGLDLANQYPHFVQMQRDLAALNRNVLDFAEKAGIIDPESRKMWESDYYVPFYRVTDDAGAGPWSAGSLAKVRNPIMRLMGGKENLNDITGNVVRNWSTLINASLKAHAVRVAVDNLSAAGVAVRVPALERAGDALVSTSEINKLLQQHGITGAISPSAVGGIQKLMSLSTPQGDDVVQVWRNGKREYYRLADPSLSVAFGALKGSPLKSLRDDPIGRALVGAATLPKMVLTKLTTENPAFGVRTLWKDNINAWTVGRGMMPVTPVVSAVTGLVRTMKADGAFKRMAAAGATFNAGRADPYDTNMTAQRYIKAPSLVGRLWDGYRNMMLSGENASRVTIYDRTLKETGSHKLAAYEARDLMDYAMRGNSPLVQFMVETVPFWGAHVQGLYKTARAMNPDNSMTYTQMAGQAAKKISALAIKGTLLSLAASTLYMHNRKNSDYMDLPDIQKELYYHLYLGAYHIKIPKAFETGTIFGTVPEAITESVMSRFSPQTLKEQGAYLMHAFGAALNLYPRVTAVTPLYELQTNKDLATGYPILSEHDQGVMPGEQTGPSTSPTVTAAARAMPSAAPNALQSPKELQHLILGYLGIMGSYALNAADFAYRKSSGLPASPTRNLNEIPVVGSFVTRTDEPMKSTKPLGELSTVMIAANQLTQTIHDLQKAGDQASIDRALKLRQENMDLVIAGAGMKPASDAIHTLQGMKRQIQMTPNMTAEEKQAKVNEIQKKIDEIARGVYEFRPGGKLNREILDRIGAETPPAAKATILRKAGMPALASIATQYGKQMPPTVQAAIEELG